MIDDLNEARNQVGLTLEPSRDSNISINSAARALTQARAGGETEAICLALIRLAHLHFRQGRYSKTCTLVEEVLHIAPAESLARCDGLRILGNCAAERGDPLTAESYYHQAIDLARQLDYPYALYKCLHSLATNIYWPRGQFELALSAGKEALAQAQLLHLGEERWFPLSDLAWVYWSTGQRELAAQMGDQMAAVVTPGSLGAGFLDCLRAGLVQPGAGYLETVLPLYERARSIAETSGDPGLMMEVRIGLCRAYRTLRDLPAARLWAEDAIATGVRLGYRQFQGLAFIEQGRTEIEIGDPRRAEAALRAALEIAIPLGSRFDQARATLYLAVVQAAQGEPEALVTWQLAASLIFDNGYNFLIEQERALILPWVAKTLNAPQSPLFAVGVAFFDRLVQLPPAPLQVKTFGQLGLQIGPHFISKESLRQRRAGELLALLLSSPGHSLAAEAVMEAMCSEKDPLAALDFYHHAISALRHLLEPDLPDRRFPCRYLEVTEGRVTLLVPPGSSIDFLEFEQAFLKKDWQRAIALYKGEYLPMFCYAEWTIALREHYADLFEQTLLAAAQGALQAAAPTTTLEMARQVLLHNPWQEQAVELGMRAALLLDDRTTALNLYRRLEKKLATDLGIAPQKELQQLFLRIKNL